MEKSSSFCPFGDPTALKKLMHTQPFQAIIMGFRSYFASETSPCLCRCGMDSITHILSAALFTEPIGCPQGNLSHDRWRGRLAIIVAALLPDADGVLGWIDSGLYGAYHRKITHSVGGLIVILFLAALIAWRWPAKWFPSFMKSTGEGNKPAHRAPFGCLLGFSAIALILHLTGDWVGAWGIWPLWSFSERDFAAGWINSLDPVILALTVAFWALQHMLLQAGRRRWAWGMAALWLMACAIYIAGHSSFGPKAFV